jgi:hypothetical protein
MKEKIEYVNELLSKRQKEVRMSWEDVQGKMCAVKELSED